MQYLITVKYAMHYKNYPEIGFPLLYLSFFNLYCKPPLAVARKSLERQGRISINNMFIPSVSLLSRDKTLDLPGRALPF